MRGTGKCCSSPGRYVQAQKKVRMKIVLETLGLIDDPGADRPAQKTLEDSIAPGLPFGWNEPLRLRISVGCCSFQVQDLVKDGMVRTAVSRYFPQS